MVTVLIYNRKIVFLKIEDDSVWYGMCVVIHSYIVKGAKSRKAFSSSSDLQTHCLDLNLNDQKTSHFY